MLLNRNSSSSKGCNWMTYLTVISIIMLVTYGGRHKIKDMINDSIAFDKNKVEAVVKEYLENNPQVIISSLQKMQEKEYEEMRKQAQGTAESITPFAGNKDGDVTIVSFLDYRCGHCKTSNDSIKALIAKDPNVKVIFRELPVLGPQSQKIAQMALAVYLIDNQKYVPFHNAVMSASSLDDKSLENILKQMNLDNAKVTELMTDPRVLKELESVMNLAQKLGIQGTPAFIIDEHLIPGAINLNGMEEIVKNARKKINDNAKKN